MTNCTYSYKMLINCRMEGRKQHNKETYTNPTSSYIADHYPSKHHITRTNTSYCYIHDCSGHGYVRLPSILHQSMTNT